MATVTGLTAERMLAIEAAAIMNGAVDLAGDLKLTTHGGAVINAGNVKGDPGAAANIADVVGLTDALGLKAVDTSVVHLAGTETITGTKVLTDSNYAPPQGSTGIRRYENVAGYANGDATATGAIVFVAPYTFTSHMQTHEIVGYNDSSGPVSAFRLRVSFYDDGVGPSVINATVEYLSDFQPMVRIGRVTASGLVCIIIGDVGSVWRYPKIQIATSYVHFGAVTDTMMAGWTSSLVTSIAAYSLLVTPANKSLSTILGNAGTATKLVTPRAINGVDFDGSAAINVNVVNTVLGTGVNLDTLTATGLYSQSGTVNATLALNYPTVQAGLLEVTGLGSGGMVYKVYQRYTTYNNPDRVFIRGWDSASGWSAWSELAKDASFTGLTANGWTPFELSNSWVNYGGAFNVAAFKKNPDGTTQLRGLIRNGAMGSAICYVPAGARPSMQSIFVCAANAGAGTARVDVFATGAVVVSSYGTGSINGWVSFEGIRFSYVD